MASAPTIQSISTLKNLRRAARRTKGIDGCDVHAEAQSAQILLRRGLYKAGPVRGFKLKGRPLVTPVRTGDLVVSRAAHQKLCRFVDQFLHPASYAFRPGRSVRMVMEAVIRQTRKGYTWALRLDIRNFFGATSLSSCLSLLEQLGVENQVLEVIQDLQVHASTSREEAKGKKLDQGLPLSPLLANLALDFLDRAITCAGFAHFRYADDILILGRTEQECLDAEALIFELLDQQWMELRDDKRVLRDLLKRPVDFLGFTFRGKTARPSKRSIRRLKEALKKEPETRQRIGLMKNFLRTFGGTRHSAKWMERTDAACCDFFPLGYTLTDLNSVTDTVGRNQVRRPTVRHTKEPSINAHYRDLNKSYGSGTEGVPRPTGRPLLKRTRSKSKTCSGSSLPGVSGGTERNPGKARPAIMDVPLTEEQYRVIRRATKMVGTKTHSKSPSFHLDMICLEFCTNNPEPPRRWAHLKKLEHLYGVSLAAYSEKEGTFVYGARLVESLQGGPVLDVGPAEPGFDPAPVRAMRFRLFNESGQRQVIQDALAIARDWTGGGTTGFLLAVICDDFWFRELKYLPGRRPHPELPKPEQRLMDVSRLLGLELFAFNKEERQCVFNSLR